MNFFHSLLIIKEFYKFRPIADVITAELLNEDENKDNVQLNSEQVEESSNHESIVKCMCR
jgi:hypothetical protein